MAQTVIGVFENIADANQAAQQLTEVGFRHADVDVSTNYRDRETTRDEDNDEGVGGFFHSLFGDSDDKYRHTEATRRGTLVTVHTQTMEEAERASEILDEYGAMDVNDESYRTGTNTTAATSEFENTDATIPVIDEKMEVGKRTRESGHVKVRSRIVERPVEEHLRLRSEHVYVDRKAVNRPASEEEMENFKESSIDVTEHEEVPVVNKEAWVVEEVDVHTDVEERDEVVRDNVRHTEVDVDGNLTDEERRLQEEERRTDDRDRI